MTWETFYLVCFVVGFSLSALSFLLGVLRLPHFHLHLPHHGGGLHLGGAHAGGAPHATGAGSYTVSPLNFPTLFPLASDNLSPISLSHHKGAVQVCT